jgi:electron transfer flavoprotein alpha subunit
LSAGKKIASDINGILCAAILGSELSTVLPEISCSTDEVYVVDHNMLRCFRPDMYANILEQLFRKVNFDVTLAAHTLNGIELSARLANRMGVEVITDCINLVIKDEDGPLLCTKPVYGAKALATFELKNKPYMATLRPKTVEPIVQGRTEGKVIPFDPIIDESMVKM